MRFTVTTIEESPVATAQIVRHPISSILLPVPIVCFVGALLTDIAYYASAEMMWADFSAWLLVIGVIVGVLAMLAGLADRLSNRLILAQAPTWPRLIGNFLALIVAFFNALIHTRDAWTSVMPIGLVLSIVTVLILLVTGWPAKTVVVRSDVGVVR
jgi:uncharacterized membrane protein